jgi:hypothetical protein
MLHVIQLAFKKDDSMKNNVCLFVTRCLVLVSVPLLFSCVTGITMNEIQGIHRGMAHEEFKLQVKIAPRSAFPLEHDGVQYAVETYFMQTGTRTQSNYVWTKYGGYTTTTQVPVYDDYYFVFDDKGLMFWGFMNEFQKSDDELVQQLAPQIATEAKEQSRQAQPQSAGR